MTEQSSKPARDRKCRCGIRQLCLRLWEIAIGRLKPGSSKRNDAIADNRTMRRADDIAAHPDRFDRMLAQAISAPLHLLTASDATALAQYRRDLVITV